MLVTELENYFNKYRENIVGINLEQQFCMEKKRVVYADWTASGRLYGPIEDFIKNKIGPFVANTHTQSSLMGVTTTDFYLQAREIIKSHVNAFKSDILISTGAGMTSAVNKLQRILNLRIPEKYYHQIDNNSHEKPLVIITHSEHHSNQISWLSCYCDLKIINRAASGLPDLIHLEEILIENHHRNLKIGSFSACSNVSGIQIPIYEMAEIMHKYDGFCFIDFAASAPYININMHPKNELQKLDAIFFSPHKFLGGPGSSGILIFDSSLYKNFAPDHPGGGTVRWTNPWGEHKFVDDIETREDGGTPGFLQTIRAALAILLKEEMGVDKILKREEELKCLILEKLKKNPLISILDPELDRLGIISFYVHGLHYNLIVKLLNDRYGIQSRGGCSCAGTYGHILLGINQEKSRLITQKIDQGDLSEKPGWVRISLHPTMKNEEMVYIAQAINDIIENYDEWEKDYLFDYKTAEFHHKTFKEFHPIHLSNIKFSSL